MAAVLLAVALFASLPLPSANAQQAGGENARLKAAIASPSRTPRYAARDQWRHPYEVLTFFGIRDDMTVIEIWPGRKGWWTEILAPYLKDHGRYVAVQRRKPKQPSEFPVFVSDFTGDTSIRPERGADMVLSFRNLHNWMKRGIADNAFRAFYAALRPGGILGLVDHRARADRPQDPKALSGYVRQDYAIKLAEKAGFVFDGISEINANARDTTDHPAGVWTLPPTLRLKDKDRTKYRAIGESDRFTLRFHKPSR